MTVVAIITGIVLGGATVIAAWLLGEALSTWDKHRLPPVAGLDEYEFERTGGPLRVVGYSYRGDRGEGDH